MKTQLYAVKDVKCAYYAPSTFENEQIAKRNFRIMMNDESMKMFKSDWELWYLGEYDNKTGKITQEEPKFIMTGEDANG